MVHSRGQLWVQCCLASLLRTWMMGQRALSASLCVLHSWEELLIDMLCCQPEGPQVSGEMGKQKSQSSVKSCISGTHTVQIPMRWKAALKKVTLVDTKLTRR